MNQKSYLDRVFRSLLVTGFFRKGWGNPNHLKRIFEYRKLISDRDICKDLVGPDYPVTIDKEEIHGEVKIIEGHFLSPFVAHVPGVMLPEVQTARFQMVHPVQWHSKWGDHLKPVCIHLASTGDHGFNKRRRFMARPLIEQAGIASIILENPYYGSRKPEKQFRSMLSCVSDLLVIGGALVLESSVLLRWCESQGYGPLGITGLSMGGYTASLGACCWHKPVSLIPCLSWTTAAPVYTEGVLHKTMDWDLLQKQYIDDKAYENLEFTSPGEHCWDQKESKHVKFMRDVLDEFTHLRQYPIPVDPSLIIIVAAEHDAYIPRDSEHSLEDLWPGSQVRYLDSGHIGAFLTRSSDFRKAIIDSFDLQVKKYFSQHPACLEIKQ